MDIQQTNNSQTQSYNPNTNQTAISQINPHQASTQQINPRPNNQQQISSSAQINSQQYQSGAIASTEEVILEIDLLERKVRSAPMPKDLMERALRNIDRLRRTARRGSYSGEFESIEKYIYWITSIPWQKITNDNLDINNAKQLMDQTHFGMETVKNLILDYLAVMQLRNINNSISTNTSTQNNNPVGISNSYKFPDSSGQNSVSANIQSDETNNMVVLRGSSANAPVMLFVGLQGVGKTSIAKSIANAMGRKFIRVSVGAMSSAQELRGIPRAEHYAEPGQIVKAIVRCGSMNPIILLDEIDKAAGNTALLSDIMATLLEILDPEQNASFIDKYIDYPIDLSKVFFVCTANNLGTLSAALLDRMEVIRFPSYTDAEKETIAKQYSMPKVLENTGVRLDQLQIQPEVWPLLIRPVGFDAGLRQLERNLATLVRSVARKILEGSPVPVVITPQNLREFVLPDQGPLS